MDDIAQQPFRFLDLPGELRNKIYDLLLCTFHVQSNGLRPRELCRAKHNTESNILRANRQIHREAYYVMIKTNRFVCIQSTFILPLHAIMSIRPVPIVAKDSHSILRFPGFVMKITLHSQPQAAGDR
jgi:hypothetical protein